MRYVYISTNADSLEPRPSSKEERGSGYETTLTLFRGGVWVRDYTDAIQSARSINQGNDFVRSNYDPKGALIGTKFYETFILTYN